MGRSVKFLAGLEKHDKFFLVVAEFLLISVIGIIDILTGYEFAFSVFYVLPISLLTWLTNRWLGLVASLASALVWLGADIITGQPYSNSLVPIWNTFIRLIFFTIITLLLSALKAATQREAEIARMDYLTGAVNRRFFYELAQMELDRLQRYLRPLTFAFLDLDNFKAVNDRFGHAVGDQVLRTVVNSIKINMRKTDIVARLGGDEIGMLLPETNQDAARVAISKIQGDLQEEMRRHNWHVTFSIGALTCAVAPQTPDELLKMADDLMYQVKHNSKNSVKHATYTG